MSSILFSRYTIWILSFSLAIVFLTASFSHLYHLHESYDPDETQLVDQKAVDEYLNNFFEDTPISAIKIPAGIFVNTITFTTGNSFLVSGYIWQKYPKDYPENLAKGFVLPEAVNLTKTLTYRHDNGTTETWGWYFEGTIHEFFDYTKYPLDNKTITIRIWHQEFSENVFMVPDYSSYKSTKAEDKFGLDPLIYLAGYDILETFYRYRQADYDTDFGFEHSSQAKDFPELYFNIALKRHATDAIISYFLPLIAVIILCFSTLISSTLDERRRAINSFSYMQVLTECAALFFIVLVSHTHLRDVFAGIGIIYLEYFYVIAYLCVIYVSINGFLVAHAELSDNIAYRFFKYDDNLWPKALFLPIFSALIMLLSLCLFS